MRKKIAFYLRDPHIIGGVSVITMDIARQLNNLEDQDYEIVILTTLCNDSLNKKMDLSVINLSDHSLSNNKKNFLKRIFLKIMNIYARAMRKFGSAKLNSLAVKHLYYDEITRLKKVIQEQQFYAVVACSPNCISKLALTNLTNNTRCVSWFHASYYKYFDYSFGDSVMHYKTIRKYIPKFHATVVLLNKMKQEYDKNFAINSVVIHNATKTQFNHSKLRNLVSIKSFGYVGRINEKHKQISHVVKAFEHINDEKLQLSIFGGTLKMFELETNYKISNQENSSIRFIDYVDNKDDIYNNIDCLLFTSKVEGFGLVLIEAMSYGIPIIAYDICDVREILKDNYNCLLVKADDIEDLSRKIVFISQNPELYANLSKNCIEFVKDFDICKITHQWVNLLNQKKA